jgi:Flp pilus assembly pilin Flp
MNAQLIQFLAQDNGQDLVEYTLLMAFVVVTMAGLVLGIGDSVKTVTTISTSQLNAADATIH